jgi:hypothetical protein
VISTPLPVPVRELPHWRVNIRPTSYHQSLVPSLTACLDAIQEAKVTLRGWDYPHLNRRDGNFANGNSWIGNWTEFGRHIEYWRFYQSGQFLHLFSIGEAADPMWHNKLKSTAHGHAFYRGDINWDLVPGYFSLLNFLYTLTEVFEFATRLSQRGIYTGEIDVTIELKKVRGFVLTPESDRSWSLVCTASEDNLGNTWRVSSTDLIADAKEKSLAATSWFFERFGWLEPNLDALRRDQERFLSGRL